MKKQLQQFCYFGDQSLKTTPGLKRSNLISGSIFPKPIIALGIQTYPGVKFYLNSATDEPIIVGSSGIFEINLTDNCEITHLEFLQESIDFIDSPNNTAYLIIDIIYNEEKE